MKRLLSIASKIPPMRSVVGRCVCNVLLLLLLLLLLLAVVSDATVTICTTRLNSAKNFSTLSTYSKTPSNLPHPRGSRTARRTKKCYLRLCMLSCGGSSTSIRLVRNHEFKKILLFPLLRRRVAFRRFPLLILLPNIRPNKQFPLPRGCKNQSKAFHLCLPSVNIRDCKNSSFSTGLSYYPFHIIHLFHERAVV